MDPKNMILLNITCAGLVYLICVTIFRQYKKMYFRSKKFIELNRTTDDVAEEYDAVVTISSQLRQMVYSDFSPSVSDQDQMVDYAEISLKESLKLPPRTYLCSKEIMDNFESYPYEFLKKYCGFSGSGNVLYHIENIHRKSCNLKQVVEEFKVEHEKQLGIVKKSAPLMIRLFSKNQLLLLLGLYVDKNWEEKVYPRYVFRDITDRKREVRIVLTPETLKEIIEYLSD